MDLLTTEGSKPMPTFLPSPDSPEERKYSEREKQGKRRDQQDEKTRRRESDNPDKENR